MKFAQPAWLILLVLLPLLGAGAFFTARMRRRQWREFVAPRLRGSLLKHGSALPRWFALIFLLAACGALVIALARPQGDDGTRTETALGRNVLVALDLSRSMRVRDVNPDRLTQAKMVIYEMLEAMPNERVGLIGFAGTANSFAPLTVDHRAVRETVEQIDESWAPVGGSDLAAAVALAIETFKETGQKNNALVILSDGEEHQGELDHMIAEAERSGIYILAIGVGTEDGDYVPGSDFPGNRMLDRSGKPVVSRLHPDVMRELAAETQGRYAVAGSGADIPAMIKAAIKDLDAFELEGRERRVYLEFYQWLVLPAIVFLIATIVAGTRWRGIRTAVAALALLPATTRADEVSAAREALENHRFAEARDAYAALAEGSRFDSRKARFRLGEGSAAYQAADFKHARSAFSQALLSENADTRAASHAGLGNSLFQIGWKSLARENYPSESAALPDLESFENAVRERLDKLLEDEDPDAPGRAGTTVFKSLVTNWTDAIRHYDSALSYQPSHRSAGHNRELTLTYLKRLREILEQEKDDTSRSMPDPPPPADQPSEPGEDGEGAEKPDDKGENGDDPEDGGEGGENDDESGDESDGGRDEREKPGSEPESEEGEGENPDESPEERARRILKETADLEKGPISPGRIDFRDPEKDW